jgi:hypothetical protein
MVTVELMTDEQRRYKVKEKKVAPKYDGLGHNRAGDIDAGASRAWRQLRRPSDMVRPSFAREGRADVQNEHAAELRRLRSKEASSGKASGTVFVKGKLDRSVKKVAS